MNTEAIIPEKLKKVELDILRQFIEVCEKLNLKWFMLYGSCLGTVRHHGFIPWDDDIDVGLMRDDYEVFLEKAPSLLPENYFLQTAKTDQDYSMNYAKIRRSDTTFIEKTVKDFNINHGIYVDIFPITEYRPSIIFDMKAKFYSICVSKAYNFEDRGCFAKRAAKGVLRVFIKDYRVARDKKEQLFRKAEKKGSGAVSTFCGNGEIMPRDLFDTVEKMSFEGIEVNVPGKWDEYLTLLYGDYMTPPPEKERTTHHYTEIIDPEKSYKEYKKETEERK